MSFFNSRKPFTKRSFSLVNLLQPVPKDKAKGWKAKVNGEPVDLWHLELVNPNIGRIEYGWRDYFDSIVIRENGGGGSVIIPYCFGPNNVLYIGFILQKRDNMSDTYNAIGGFLTADEVHFEVAKRELQEEAGFVFADRIHQLSGISGNPNRAYFVTHEPEAGIHFYGLEVRPDEVCLQHEKDQAETVLLFNQDVLKPLSPMGEKIARCQFLPWYVLAGRQDMFLGDGIARLLAFLFFSERIAIRA